MLLVCLDATNGYEWPFSVKAVELPWQPTWCPAGEAIWTQRIWCIWVYLNIGHPKIQFSIIIFSWHTCQLSHSTVGYGSTQTFAGYYTTYPHSCLVGGFNPSEKNSSIGMMKFPIYGKNNIHVPNHQPVVDFIAPFSRRNGIKTVHFLWTSTK